MRAFEQDDGPCRHRWSEKREQVTAPNSFLSIRVLAELKRLPAVCVARQTQEFGRLEGPWYLGLAGCQPQLPCSAAQAGRKILAGGRIEMIAKVVRKDNRIAYMSCSRSFGCSQDCRRRRAVRGER